MNSSKYDYIKPTKKPVYLNANLSKVVNEEENEYNDFANEKEVDELEKELKFKSKVVIKDINKPKRNELKTSLKEIDGKVLKKKEFPIFWQKFDKKFEECEKKSKDEMGKTILKQMGIKPTTLKRANRINENKIKELNNEKNKKDECFIDDKRALLKWLKEIDESKFVEPQRESFKNDFAENCLDEQTGMQNPIFKIVREGNLALNKKPKVTLFRAKHINEERVGAFNNKLEMDKDWKELNNKNKLQRKNAFKNVANRIIGLTKEDEELINKKKKQVLESITKKNDELDNLNQVSKKFMRKNCKVYNYNDIYNDMGLK